VLATEWLERRGRWIFRLYENIETHRRARLPPAPQTETYDVRLDGPAQPFARRGAGPIVVALPPESDTPGHKKRREHVRHVLGARTPRRARHGLTLALTGPGVPFCGSLSRLQAAFTH
jgi:hypothetical protein